MLRIAAICLVITALILALIGLDAMGIAQGLRQYEESFLRSIDFSNVLMQGMLTLLLFASHFMLTSAGSRLPLAGACAAGRHEAAIGFLESIDLRRSAWGYFGGLGLVVFSILAQGLSIGRVTRRAVP